ncbi:MAG: hypothetical protein J6V99_02585, partial [Neisseriaceae bacterium]|nr:hypothetical protein [Neisseriaceae bacterium]
GDFIMFYQCNYGNLFADSFFILNGKLMFASLHGREADMLGLIANLSDGGRDLLMHYGDLSFFSNENQNRKFRAIEFNHLCKEMTKYSHPDYGAITHCFIYDEALKQINHDRKSAWLVLADSSIDEQKALSNILREVSDIPLLDDWHRPLIIQLMQSGHIKRFVDPSDFIDRPYGDGILNLRAFSIEIPNDFEDLVKTNLQSECLTV